MPETGRTVWGGAAGSSEVGLHFCRTIRKPCFRSQVSVGCTLPASHVTRIRAWPRPGPNYDGFFGVSYSYCSVLSVVPGMKYHAVAELLTPGVIRDFFLQMCTYFLFLMYKQVRTLFINSFGFWGLSREKVSRKLTIVASVMRSSRYAGVGCVSTVQWKELTTCAQHCYNFGVARSSGKIDKTTRC